MCQANTQDRVRAVMAKMTGKAPEVFAPTAKLDALGLDSLDRVEIAMQLEKDFGIAFQADTEFDWSTVGDVFNAVKELHG